MMMDGATDPTHEDGTISQTRQKSIDYYKGGHLSQEGYSCNSSMIYRPKTRGQPITNWNPEDLSAQIGVRETQSTINNASPYKPANMNRFRNMDIHDQQQSKICRNIKINQLTEYNHSQGKAQPSRIRTNQGNRQFRQMKIRRDSFSMGQDGGSGER